MAIALVCGVSVVWGAGAAAAHGPCRCLEPSSGPPGTNVVVSDSYRVVEVIWNPDPAELENPALEAVYGDRRYREDSPTQTVSSRSATGRGATFHIPHEVEEGRYVVVLLDGTEGGSHYTWGMFTVAERGAIPRTMPNLDPWLKGAGMLLAVGAIFLGIAGILSRR